MFTRKPRLQLGKIVISSAKKLLQQYLPIGDIATIPQFNRLQLF